MNSEKITSEVLANVIVAAIKEKKGEKITKLDMRKADGSICDYFVICQADNQRQVLAIADEIDDYVRENASEKPLHIQGKENAEWVLLDYVTVVVHVFLDKSREFYRLESLWADAERTDYPDEILGK
ncbi:MAG: ribosome silencing factor [Bacteroidales bacterium]|nr:ribosome silencing factor [Bacteroidales bacterium]